MRIFLFFVIMFEMILAEEYAVVVNKNISIDSLTEVQVKSIFLKKSLIINNLEMVPINLLASDELRLSFESEVLKMSRGALQSFWVKEHYMGHRPPVNMKSSKSVVAFVKKIDGAIGYIRADEIDDELKIVYKWSQNDSSR